ncbi:MAG: rubrerythrin family protein [Planctomycetota bacterium]
MSKTEKDLKEAFAGESQANRKYTAFARKAEDDGLPQVARLFRAAARAETVHALNHLDVMGGVNETLDNLKEASEGEAAEFENMYPDFLKDAEDEGDDDAYTTFDYANQVEEIHHRMYNEAIEAVQNGEDLPETDLFVCKGCGNTVEGEVPDECPICGSPKSWFMKID